MSNSKMLSAFMALAILNRNMPWSNDKTRRADEAAYSALRPLPIETILEAYAKINPTR